MAGDTNTTKRSADYWIGKYEESASRMKSAEARAEDLSEKVEELYQQVREVERTFAAQLGAAESEMRLLRGQLARLDRGRGVQGNPAEPSIREPEAADNEQQKVVDVVPPAKQEGTAREAMLKREISDITDELTRTDLDLNDVAFMTLWLDHVEGEANGDAFVEREVAELRRDVANREAYLKRQSAQVRYEADVTPPKIEPSDQALPQAEVKRVDGNYVDGVRAKRPIEKLVVEVFEVWRALQSDTLSQAMLTEMDQRLHAAQRELEHQELHIEAAKLAHKLQDRAYELGEQQSASRD